MSKSSLVSLVLLSGAIFSGTAFAQRGTAETTISGKNIAVEYGRPSLQGRDMLGKLAVGQSWRMGSNAATTLKTDARLKFGDTVVEPGTYRLTATRVSEDRFHLVVNRDSGGNIEVPLTRSSLGSSVETLTINLDSKGGSAGTFSMSWGNTKLAADFTAE